MMDVNMSTQAVTARDIAAGKAGVSGGQKTSEAGGFMELIMRLGKMWPAGTCGTSSRWFARGI